MSYKNVGGPPTSIFVETWLADGIHMALKYSEVLIEYYSLGLNVCGLTRLD